MKKFQTFDSSLFTGQSYFFNDTSQLYLIFQTLYCTLKRLGDNEKVVSWKSKGLSAENVTIPTTAGNSLSPSIKWYRNANFCLVFKGGCLKQKAVDFNPPNKIDFFIVYELDTWSQDLNSDFPLKDCLLWSVKLAKNADPDKYVYSGYGIGFNLRSEFSLPDDSTGKNVTFLELVWAHQSILIIREMVILIFR